MQGHVNPNRLPISSLGSRFPKNIDGQSPIQWHFVILRACISFFGACAPQTKPQRQQHLHPFAIIDFLWGCNLLWRYDLQTHTWLKRHGFSSSPNAPAPVDGTSSSPFHVHVGPVDGPMALAHPWSDLMARDARSENSKESSANEQPAVCSFWKQWHCHVNLLRWLAMNGLMICGLCMKVISFPWVHHTLLPCSCLSKARSRVWDPSMLRYITVVNRHCDCPKTSQPENKIVNSFSQSCCFWPPQCH